ncbi:GTP cyclohydrolase II [Pneumocystis murina B123]|uniref:GTP cyclohydrolase II n=1 Tax=Pneumocystis murina (strain B123) TaxID=1069680 RepID=M7NWT9_PNEMU|nr:GTP cyclohydrolase II [Pneumocystis murina B123]EMR11621.1 GTP cyclohydrolase II [Pneumocystis murina B123]
MLFESFQKDKDLSVILPQVECIVRARIPTISGTEHFIHLYHNDFDKKEHLAIVFGNKIKSSSLYRSRNGETETDRMIRGAYNGKLYPGRTSSKENCAESNNYSLSRAPLVRIHSECYTGEIAWSARCDCGEQLEEARRLMTLENDGVIIYLRQEGRGIGLKEKLKAYNLQDLGNDTVQANLFLNHPADARTYGVAIAILLDLGLKNVRLLTNNPDKIRSIEKHHQKINVIERIPMIPRNWTGENKTRIAEKDKYLSTKVEKMGHLLTKP